eukprot:INCI15564.1.p1 GENE.INCI15564.1~~INCI15564.1.p1  ORF type:complete len:511 (+),score=80.33 INCI15564.1:111-1535(+)
MQDGMMAFQEEDQLQAVRQYCKYAARPPSIDRFPFFLDRAIRIAVSGRPGPVYLDLPGDMVNSAPSQAALDAPLPTFFPTAGSLADTAEVQKAVQLLQKAKRPLVVVGKGMAYARAEAEVRELVQRFGLPVLPTPMGKGVVSDLDPRLVIAARSKALQEADVVLLLGARLNWILHFGLPPRFRADASFIKLDVDAAEMGNNRRAAAALCGDGRLVAGQLVDALKADGWTGYSKGTESGTGGDAEWFQALRAKVAASTAGLQTLMDDERSPMSYYRAFRDVHGLAPRDAIIVTEGANTMDIGRGILDNDLPRHRLDAGSYGTMGVGLGQALAAQAVHPEKKVICIEGDSAIGFSLAELETFCRYRLPITVVVINNSGIGVGLPISGDTHEERLEDSPVTSLTQHARYDKVIEAFGGKGYFVERPEQLARALSEAYSSPEPTLVNVSAVADSWHRRNFFVIHDNPNTQSTMSCCRY